jgi:hypothetical protein
MRLELRAWNAELIADGSRCRFLNLTMSGKGCALAILGIAMDRMIRAFSIQVTAMFLHVSNKIAALHAAGTSTVSFSQMALPGASLAAFSR